MALQEHLQDLIHDVSSQSLRVFVIGKIYFLRRDLHTPNGVPILACSTVTDFSIFIGAALTCSKCTTLLFFRLKLLLARVILPRNSTCGCVPHVFPRRIQVLG